MRIRVCWYKNAGVAGYAEAFRPVQSDSQASEWYSYFENDVLGSVGSAVQGTDICDPFTIYVQKKDRHSSILEAAGSFLNTFFMLYLTDQCLGCAFIYTSRIFATPKFR